MSKCRTDAGRTRASSYVHNMHVEATPRTIIVRLVGIVARSIPLFRVLFDWILIFIVGALIETTTSYVIALAKHESSRAG